MHEKAQFGLGTGELHQGKGCSPACVGHFGLQRFREADSGDGEDHMLDACATG